jgi:hypothetical protein
VPNLQAEREHLALADRHISDAETHIAHLRTMLNSARAAGDDTELAQRTLSAAEEGLQVFVEHRELIVRTIDDIRAGRLRST